jgi:2-oxoglutarate ferredoxin oxidoreductase subunit alpha
MPIVAPATPSDCFEMAVEAFRIAAETMSPVIFLSDGYLANSSEPWKIPNPDDIPTIEINHPTDPSTYLPYKRDPITLARPWALPGTPGLEHRLGGLGKEDGTGNVSYDPDDNQHMANIRAERITRIADRIPLQRVMGPRSGDLLVVGWGGTYGAIRTAVRRAQQKGQSVAATHLRYLNPFPKNLGDILNRYKQVLVPELNMGQLSLLLNAKYPKRVISYPKVQGLPFKISEISSKVDDILGT